MSYYQPIRGDYMASGDPGLFSSAWKIIKGAGKAFLGIGQKAPVPIAIGAGIAGQQIANLAMPGGAAIGPPLPANGQAGMLMQGGCCPAGYHPDKRTGTKCVRNRRMNPANPKALRRSMRRVQGFEKLAKRTIQFTRRTRLKK